MTFCRSGPIKVPGLPICHNCFDIDGAGACFFAKWIAEARDFRFGTQVKSEL